MNGPGPGSAGTGTGTAAAAIRPSAFSLNRADWVSATGSQSSHTGGHTAGSAQRTRHCTSLPSVSVTSLTQQPRVSSRSQRSAASTPSTPSGSSSGKRKVHFREASEEDDEQQTGMDDGGEEERKESPALRQRGAGSAGDIIPSTPPSPRPHKKQRVPPRRSRRLAGTGSRTSTSQRLQIPVVKERVFQEVHIPTVAAERDHRHLTRLLGQVNEQHLARTPLLLATLEDGRRLVGLHSLCRCLKLYGKPQSSVVAHWKLTISKWLKHNPHIPVGFHRGVKLEPVPAAGLFLDHHAFRDFIRITARYCQLEKRPLLIHFRAHLDELVDLLFTGSVGVDQVKPPPLSSSDEESDGEEVGNEAVDEADEHADMTNEPATADENQSDMGEDQHDVSPPPLSTSQPLPRRSSRLSGVPLTQAAEVSQPARRRMSTRSHPAMYLAHHSRGLSRTLTDETTEEKEIGHSEFKQGVGDFEDRPGWEADDEVDMRQQGEVAVATFERVAQADVQESKEQSQPQMPVSPIAEHDADRTAAAAGAASRSESASSPAPNMMGDTYGGATAAAAQPLSTAAFPLTAASSLEDIMRFHRQLNIREERAIHEINEVKLMRTLAEQMHRQH